MWNRLFLLLAGCAMMSLGSCGTQENVHVDPPPAIIEEADAFLSAYSATYQKLYTEASEAEWASNTKIVEGDDTNAKRTQAAQEAMARFTGSADVIATARGFLDHKDSLRPLQVKQLDAILYAAANQPQTVPDLVKARIAAETRQTELLYGYDYKIDGKSVTTNAIDDILKTENDLGKRLAAWEASKRVGVGLKSGLEDLQRLRNSTVRALGYDDYFSYQVSDYGMSRRELLDLMEKLNKELRPLYRELHTYMRYELANRYGQPIPDLIPAEWLPNRWGQDWGALVTVEGFDLDGALRKKSAGWIIHQAERFYRSLGFEALPQSFWDLSSLYPLPPGTTYKKNNHASAWHMDLERDVRSLMSIEPNSEWFETTHHELGHIYYYLSYANPDVPILLRRGANRAFHEAVGSLMGLAAMQPRFAQTVGVAPEMAPDPIQNLLKEALNYVVFIPWSAGVMTRFENDLYADELPADQWNDRWWALKARYQGIAPPGPRPANACDPATKTHINDDAAQYYDYALSYVILFQLHDHIAREILHEDPHNTNYYGRREVGEFLRGLLRPGATRDWEELLKEATGEGLTAKPMLRYFQPLLDWLKKENAGRKHTLPRL